jgi:hypothetical protein
MKTIDEVIKSYGGFFAFGEKQFNEQKKEGIKYTSCGMGLICPSDNVENMMKEIETTSKETKKAEKKEREERAEKLKAQMLPVEERIQNRKILIAEAISRINNYMDDCYVAEHYKMLERSNRDNIAEVIDSLINAINWRINERPEVKDVYNENLTIIKELKDEIVTIYN